MSLLALTLAGAVAVAGGAQSPDEAPRPDVPVLTERIHQRLQRPASLQLQPREPDFRVAVEEDARLRRTALDMLREELAADVLRSLPPPLVRKAGQLVAVDLIQLAMSITHSINAARRARGERNARREVAAALAEFCASHDCSVLEQELKESPLEGVLTH